ncbi:MAG: hypothetical protein JSV52_10230 [Candidatus Zixiibacteriota bacterium]|nr:MAG: hypothetical protein JSV52_10230 [candidate division Zixibacteria bacterium]
MSRVVLLVFSMVLILSLADTASAERRILSFVKLDSAVTGSRNEIRVRPDSATSILPLTGPPDSVYWLVNGWVTGGELYKKYFDPSRACDDAYPYFISQVNLPMYFAKPISIVASVDIEDVYYSSPDCPWPDSVLAISMDYQVVIPEAGLYDIWIPLDEPLAVNGPFFAGFFVGNSIDSTSGVALLTNEDSTASCRSYNIWDERFGFIDLQNNGVWDFPGQLCLYVSGRAGGKEITSHPKPRVKILTPADGQQVLGETKVWVQENSSSQIIDYVVFEYGSAKEFAEIGRDFDGTRALRDGLSASRAGDGYSHFWNFASLDEGWYTLRVTAYDTLGRSGSDEISVYLEPTPPTPLIVSPKGCSNICSGFDLRATCPDDNLSTMRVFHKTAAQEYSADIRPLHQIDFGDTNGDQADGNLPQNDEYGYYYSGPVAAAMAVQLWVERGYSSLTEALDGDGSTDWLVEDFAGHFRTRENRGTFDDDLYAGLLEHNVEHGEPLIISTQNQPSYSTIRAYLEEEEQAVILALGGAPSTWVVVDGFSEWKPEQEHYLVRVCDPLCGEKKVCPLREDYMISKLKLGEEWHAIDRMVAVGANGWRVSRALIGEDPDESDGWALTWFTDQLAPSSCHFIRVEAVDSTGIRDHRTIILGHDCSQFQVAGDYNGDGVANILDLAYLGDFLGNRGPEPVGGSARADANGDRHINVTDLVYYVNYLYGGADPPCH